MLLFAICMLAGAQGAPDTEGLRWTIILLLGALGLYGCTEFNPR
jgi:hypothetical protein